MRVLLKNRFLILALFAAIALSGCDLFNSGDDETPTSPLLANVVLVGSATQQANSSGNATFVGQVVNLGSVTANNVRVSVNVFNASSSLIDVASTIAVPSNLAAQETGTFLITTTTPNAQAITFNIVIEWD
jgi:hypothetical protein